VLTVKKGAGLRICVFDNVTDCRVFITEYTGDGTTLTINDLVPIPEKKEFDDEADENTSEDANENTVEHADENADEEAEEETP
jgi:hypothetical protein